MNIRLFVVVFSLLFLVGCYQEIREIRQFQCYDGSTVEAIELCPRADYVTKQEVAELMKGLGVNNGPAIRQEIVQRDIVTSDKEYTDVARKVVPSVVAIVTNKGSGSGVIVRDEGYIVTNSHVISNATAMTVILSDRRFYTASLVGEDPKADLAVIKINDTSLPVASLGDSESAEVGEKVLSIGNPFGFDFTVTQGIISAKNRDRGPTEYRDFIQTDASINPGNSGGPLVDLDGKVIGITTFIYGGSSSSGVGFAIPIEMVNEAIFQLIKYGVVTRGYLGMETRDRTQMDRMGVGKIVNGAVVVSVDPIGPGLDAGILRGDVITHIDNVLVKDSNQFKNMVARLRNKQAVKLDVIRNGQALDDMKIVAAGVQ